MIIPKPSIGWGTLSKGKCLDCKKITILRSSLCYFCWQKIEIKLKGIKR